jgi:hypothetical protein
VKEREQGKGKGMLVEGRKEERRTEENAYYQRSNGTYCQIPPALSALRRGRKERGRECCWKEEEKRRKEYA